MSKKPRPAAATKEIRLAVLTALEACEAKKADDIALLELEPDSGAFTDYFVIATGTNPRQVQAISDDVEERLAKQGQHPTHVEGYKQAEWVLLDYVDFVVHVFSPSARKFYDLERLWKSAQRVTAEELSAPRKKAVAHKRTGSKTTRERSLGGAKTRKAHPKKR
jgi:ribosome-associated protein